MKTDTSTRSGAAAAATPSWSAAIGEPGRAVDGQREARAAQQELAPVEARAGRLRRARVARGDRAAGAAAARRSACERVKSSQQLCAIRLVCRSGEVATSTRSAFWRRTE